MDVGKKKAILLHMETRWEFRVLVRLWKVVRTRGLMRRRRLYLVCNIVAFVRVTQETNVFSWEATNKRMPVAQKRLAMARVVARVEITTPWGTASETSCLCDIVTGASSRSDL